MFLKMKLNIYIQTFLFFFYLFFHIYLERIFYTMKELDIKKK